MLTGNPKIDLAICILGYAWACWSEGLGRSDRFKPNFVIEFLEQFFVGGWQAVKADLPEPVVEAVEALGQQVEQSFEGTAALAAQVQAQNQHLAESAESAASAELAAPSIKQVGPE